MLYHVSPTAICTPGTDEVAPFPRADDADAMRMSFCCVAILLLSTLTSNWRLHRARTCVQHMRPPMASCCLW